MFNIYLLIFSIRSLEDIAPVAPFQTVNSILKNVAVTIPGPFTTSGTGYNAALKNIVCKGAQLTDLSLNTIPKAGGAQVDVVVSLKGLSFECSIEYTYQLTAFGHAYVDGGGGLAATEQNGNLDIVTTFSATPSLNKAPLSSFTVGSQDKGTCTPNIAISSVTPVGDDSVY
jgi:hypothetical protein